MRTAGLNILGGGNSMTDLDRRKFGFSRNLQKAMDTEDMTPSDLARKAWDQDDGPGANGRGMVGDYLAMKSLPTPSKLRRIAKALHTTAEKLLPPPELQTLPQPNLKIELLGDGYANLKVNAMVMTSTALKVAELVEADKLADEYEE